MDVTALKNEANEALAAEGNLSKTNLNWIKFETINMQIFLCTVIAGFLESTANNGLSFSFAGISLLFLSIVANILLVEGSFRLIKAVKSGKNWKS